LNTFLLFCIVNACICVGERISREREINAIDRQREALWVERYHDYTRAQFRELNRETSQLENLVDEPFVGYTWRPVSGKWVNVDEHGFRRSKDNGPWPPDTRNLNIFVFGNSNAFGATLTDEETIPSCLQTFLRDKCVRNVKVYNFGGPAYNSTQERIMFSNLLVKGGKPDVAVFIDGSIDFRMLSDTPCWTRLLGLMDQRTSTLFGFSRQFLACPPITRLLQKVNERLQREPSTSPNQGHLNQKQIAQILARYLRNKRLIESGARAYGVRTLFVWQPAPSYKYDRKYLSMVPWRNGGRIRFWGPSDGYAVMAKRLQQNSRSFGTDFLWLADMQEQATEPLYTDNDHYRAKFCKAIAVEIGRSLLEGGEIAGKDALPAVSYTSCK
jgi:hypothetical protein